MARIELRESPESERGEWNRFVRDAANGTLFHDRDFLAYHDQGKHEPVHLGFYKGGSLMATLSLAIEEGEDRRIARSPYGASLGGFVVSPRLAYRYCEDIVALARSFLEERGVNEVVVVPTPHFYAEPYSCYMEFLLHRQGACLKKREVTSVVPLDPSKAVFDLITGSTRTAARKALKSGVELVCDSADVGAFYDVLKKSKKRRDTTPTHSLSELTRIVDLCPGKVKLDLATIGERIAGGILYFLCNRRVAMTFYIADDEEHRSACPINLLLVEGIEWATSHGYSFLDLGTTTADMEPRAGLMAFKEGFGAVGAFRDTFVWQL